MRGILEQHVLAGPVLENAGERLEAVEADISVLGTVVRQVAETVADLEDGRRRQIRREAAQAAAAPIPAPPRARRRGPIR